MKTVLTLTCLGAVALAPVLSQAQALGAASDYNLFTLQDANVSNSDVEGRVAVGGNYTQTNYSVALKQQGGTAVVVGGNFSAVSGTIYGNVVAGGTATTQWTDVRGTVQSGMPIDFVAAGTYLRSASSQWAALTPTGTVQNNWGSLLLTGTLSMNVFSITATQLAATNSLSFNVPAGATVLVNVSGTSAQTNYAGYSYNNTSLNDPTNVNSGKILWNFSEATQLDLRSIGGTIFAPKADVTSYYNAVNGQIVAKSFTGTGQTNYHPFTGNLPTVQTVPEPATLAIFGVGFLGLLRRRASRKA